MRVEFWGTRGSIAKPGPKTVRYGGNTSCIEVRSTAGTLVILDCGTGAHPLGQKLMSAGAKGLRGHILISHTHWDHIQGIPFFAPLFVPGNEWNIYGPRGLDQPLRETLAGQMQYTYFPVTPDQFGATIRYHDLVEGAFDIDEIKVSTHYLNHPALTLGYRLETDGATIVYCCDHEPHSHTLASGQGKFVGQDLRHAEFVHGADLLIHDAQYTAAEYPAKIGWGHSSVEYAVKLAQHAHVKRLVLTHHDPLREDDAVDRVLEGIRARLQDTASPLKVSAAAEGDILEIESSGAGASERPVGEFKAIVPLEPALTDRSVLLGVADSSVAADLSDAIRAEGLQVNFFSGVDEAQELIAKDRPSLVILEHDVARVDAIKICRAIRQIDGDPAHQLSVIMVAARHDPAVGAAAGVTDWLIKPFTTSSARTKIRAWVLRTACRSMRATIPDKEERRIAALRELRTLDTEPEERFDRFPGHSGGMNMTECSSRRLPRALIVEDEVLIALMLESDMKALGFAVCGLATNAGQAISLAINERPDIAIMDIYLNGARDGIETARRLRELCGVPVIFVTAYSDDEGIMDRIQQQVPDAPVLAKPLHGHRLADAIAEVGARTTPRTSTFGLTAHRC
jgi:phosphoribosyl 1,2-cyclic phosphodiesterase/DNA-binding response OmpR family regulator